MGYSEIIVSKETDKKMKLRVGKFESFVGSGALNRKLVKVQPRRLH